MIAAARDAVELTDSEPALTLPRCFDYSRAHNHPKKEAANASLRPGSVGSRGQEVARPEIECGS